MHSLEHIRKKLKKHNTLTRMAFSKTFLLLTLAFAVLLVSSEVISARESALACKFLSHPLKGVALLHDDIYILALVKLDGTFIHT